MNVTHLKSKRFRLRPETISFLKEFALDLILALTIILFILGLCTGVFAPDFTWRELAATVKH